MDNCVILGDYIADVYIDNNNISQNQEIINAESYKGYYESLAVYPGGCGFVLESLLDTIHSDLNFDYRVKYLLPNFNYVNYKDDLHGFNLHELFDRSIKYLSNKNYQYFDIIKMQSVYYLNDIIKPTVKFRFYSKKQNQVFYRFDVDNDIEMKHIDTSYAFNEKNNSLILIDYDKGYFTEESIKNLLDDILCNGWKIDTVFLNTKPHKIEYFKKIITELKRVCGAEVIIQLNEKEYDPVKKFIHSYDYKYLVVTRGTDDIIYFDKDEEKSVEHRMDISHTLINDIYTTSGCGDIFMSLMMYYYIFVENDIKKSIKFSIENIKEKIIKLNNKLFM
jgi:hypothetical protein